MLFEPGGPHQVQNLKNGELQDIEFETAEKYFGSFAGDLYRSGERIYGYH